MASEGVTRKLAAIVAADMVGYSRLMGLDEAGTVTRQKACLDELINPKIKEYGGRLVKTTGDGLLIEFPSAVDAVLCAVTIQREMVDREADIAEDHRIQYRVGINLGEIIIEGDDIFGDGVNVASRLETLAEPGGIRISRAVFNNVKGKLDLGFSDLGLQKVKNIAEPIPTYQVLLDPEDVGKFIKAKVRPAIIQRTFAAIVLLVMAIAGYLAWDQFFPPKPTTASVPRLLVLPFTSESEEAELFANGATENFISSFALMKGMTVVKRSIALQYKGMKPAVDELSSKLSVGYVLDGQVGLDNGNINVSARLRNVSDTNSSKGNAVWEDTLNGSTEQIFELFAKLKKKTTASMDVTLNAKERQLLEDVPTKNMKAYLLYMEARRLLESGDWSKYRKSLSLHEKAFTIEPKFRYPQLGYAWANFIAWNYTLNLFRYTIDARAAAEKTIKEILANDPKNPNALELKIIMQVSLLDRENALTMARAAVFEQPDEPRLKFAFGVALLASDHVTEAREEFESYLSLSPRLTGIELRTLAEQYLRLGDAEMALSFLNQVQGDDAVSGPFYERMAETYARLGNIKTAKEFLRKRTKTFPATNLAWYKPNFDIYKNPQVYEEYAKAMTSAGMPKWAYGLDTKLEADRLLENDLKQLFEQGSFRAMDATGALGKPYQSTINSDGSLTLQYNTMPGIEFTGTWRINGDQVCFTRPGWYRGREVCSQFYIDRKRSTANLKRYIWLEGFGPHQFAIERLED